MTSNTLSGFSRSAFRIFSRSFSINGSYNLPKAFQRGRPSPIQRAKAFCRNEPSDRFIALSNEVLLVIVLSEPNIWQSNIQGKLPTAFNDYEQVSYQRRLSRYELDRTTEK